MRRLAPGAFVVVLVAMLQCGQAQTQAVCEGAPTPQLFAEWETSLENLAFDGVGNLYLSDVGGQRILVFGPAGFLREIAIDAHGLVWGPDDRLYAIVTAGDVYDVQRSTDATVTAFEVYSRGVTTYNGMAFDGAGNLYVSDDSVTPPAEPPDLIRIPAADPMRWAPWTDLYGPNGLAYDAATGVLYTVITADQASPVLRVSTTEPPTVGVVTYLSFGVATLEPGFHDPQGDPVHPVPKGLDDLALGPDGKLYITAHLSGELLKVDPISGDACLLASGLEEPTSARFARGFGEHAGKLFVTTWGGTGVTGIALGQADMHPVGKVWMFDLGLPDAAPPGPPPSANGTMTPEGSTDTPMCIDYCGTDPFDDNEGKDSPLGPAALLALVLALAMAVVGRRRVR